MHILFLDESGTPPNNPSGNQRYFVIAGLTVPAGEWKSLQTKLAGIKTRHGIRGEIRWRFFAPGNRDESNPLRELNEQRRNQVREEVYALITSYRSVKVVAAVTAIAPAYALPWVESDSDIYHMTYKPVTERFQYYLQDLSRSVGAEQYGIVVADHRERQQDGRLRSHHNWLLETNSALVSRYDNLIETVFFTPSHMSVGIQLADMVAGAIWRHFERGDDRWFRIIRGAIRSGPGGQIDGYGIARVPKRTWR